MKLPIALLLLAAVPVWVAAQGAGRTRIPEHMAGVQQAAAGSPHASCPDCHATHSADGTEGLLKVASVRKVCLECHEALQGVVPPESAARPPQRIEASGNHASAHPGVPYPDPDGQHFVPNAVKWRDRRVLLEATCAGCHDTHTNPSGGYLGRLIAFDSRGGAIDPKPKADYDVCFGCHGDRPGNDPKGRATPVLFGTGSRSAHPVGPYGRTTGSVSLLQGAPRTLACGSCHGNSEGGDGADGPHYSGEPSLLRLHYEPRDGTPESEEAYALCYACHSRASILEGQSFKFHRQHITGLFEGKGERSGGFRPLRPRMEGFGPSTGPGLPPRSRPGGPPTPGAGRLERATLPTSCATCHDPHGSRDNQALVVFDRSAVHPSSSGVLSFRRYGPGSGECTLACHGYDHYMETY